MQSGLSSEFNIHLSPCIHHCTCWLNLTSNDCSNTCQFDESSCLKQKFSTCNLDDFSIKYNESGVVETYLCKNREKSKADTGSKLIIILGSAFICIMLITIGYLCMRIYQTRHETGGSKYILIFGIIINNSIVIFVLNFELIFIFRCT